MEACLRSITHPVVDYPDADSSGDEDWELLIPEYVYPERVRLLEKFWVGSGGI